MPDQPPIAAVIGLPPDDTVRVFEARDQLRATVKWSEMWHEDHARAFTVAKVAKLDLLAAIRDSLHPVMNGGMTFEQWQASIVPQLQRAGWWGEVSDKSLTGTDETVTVDPRRLRTIYDTNLRMSRAAGRWARIQALKGARPFLRYTAVMDARTRPQHRTWNGTILPVDHEWWDTHFPPCGWFCRCTVRQLSQRDMDSRKWGVTKVPPEGAPTLFHPSGRGSPVLVPAGIDPGFGYNPGKASMAAVADKATRSLEAAAPDDLAAAQTVLQNLVNSDAMFEALNEPGASFPVMIVGPALRDALGATNQVVTFSHDSYRKQAGAVEGNLGHNDLTPDDYRLLPQIGADPDHVFNTRDVRYLLWKRGDDRNRLAVIKVLREKGEMWLLSYRFAQDDELKMLLDRHDDLAS